VIYMPPHRKTRQERRRDVVTGYWHAMNLDGDDAARLFVAAVIAAWRDMGIEPLEGEALF
jgi:hypothetical protein